MSIINEALKKACESKDIKSKTPDAALPTLSEVPYQKPLLQESAVNAEPKIESKIKEKKVKFSPLAFIIIIPILVLVLIAAMVFNYKNTGNYPAEIASTTNTQTPIAPIVKSTTLQEPENVLASSAYNKTGEPRLQLTGIIHGEGDSMAIINGSVYTVGDKIGNTRVLKITGDKVAIEDGAKVLELKVK